METISTVRWYVVGANPLDSKMKVSSEERLMAIILQGDIWLGMKVVVNMKKEYTYMTDKYPTPLDLPGSGDPPEWSREWERYFLANWQIKDVGVVDGGQY